MSFYGEFGATESIQKASEEQAQSQERLRYFRSLLDLDDVAGARKYAKEQRKSGFKIFSLLLKKAEKDAKELINRP